MRRPGHAPGRQYNSDWRAIWPGWLAPTSRWRTALPKTSCPRQAGTFDTARPRPVSCSRFRRQIQTPRGAWIWHLGTPAQAGEPFYLGAVSRPFKPALLDLDLG